MGIRVECPNGHVYKVKEKYAGKRGYCPLCTDKVSVQVPATLSTISSPPRTKSKSTESDMVDDDSESVLDYYDKGPLGSRSGSLLNSSLIRERSTCKTCGAKVPSWFASCPDCGDFM